MNNKTGSQAFCSMLLHPFHHACQNVIPLFQVSLTQEMYSR